MRFILVSMGSLGDTLPFLYVGEALKSRGHDVTLLGNEAYRNLIESRGLGFSPILSKERYQNFLKNREQGGQKESIEDMCRLIVEQVLPVHEYIVGQHEPKEMVVCAQGYAIGARLAQITHGIPLATVHLQPMWMRSALDMPPLSRWLVRWIGRPLQWIGDVLIDAAVGKSIRQSAQSLGVTPDRRIMKQWWNSDDCVLGFFPDWYGAPQSDWPSNAQCVGFPLPKITDANFNADEWRRFIDAGDPPLVFTQSTIASDSAPYFRTSIEIAERLQSRAIFLTTMPEAIQANLPEGMRSFGYVPLEAVLPFAKAHIHHGGMGAIAHSLRAGVPQVTVAKVFDQPANSAWLTRLGVSLDIKPSKYRVAVASKIEKHVQSPMVLRRCEEYAARMHAEDPMSRCCDILEGLASKQSEARTLPASHHKARLPMATKESPTWSNIP